MISVSKTQTSIRHGIGTQSLTPEESPSHIDDIATEDEKSPEQLIKSPAGSIISKDTKKRNKEGNFFIVITMV